MLILILALRILPFLLSFTNSGYVHVFTYNIAFSCIVLFYFRELQKLKIGYTSVIGIALLLPIVLYSINFAITHLYYFFHSEEKKQIEHMLQMAKNSTGLLALVNDIKSPLEYSILDSLTNNKAIVIWNFYHNGDYLFAMSQFVSMPIVLLMYYSKYVLFRNLSIKIPILSSVYPFNYFALIDKFGLSRKWKFYLLIPFFNFFIMYRINVKITTQYNLKNSNSLGMIVLPFLYYPKLVFNKYF